MHQAARAQKWLARWWVAIALCVALLILRSWFFVAWEEGFFDSDQAIVGLMAKHLAEGRSLPLFFYGQEYMLGVESWLAAPFLALFGTSVAVFRGALVTLNLVTGLLLLWLLRRDSGLGIWAAAAATSVFWIAPVPLAIDLLEAGSNIELFLWVLIFWLLRHRPLALGVALGVAFLNREFSLYAAPMLALAHLVEGEWRWRPIALNWLAIAAAFLIVGSAVQLLKPHADLLGPGSAGVAVVTRGQGTLSLALERVHWNASELGGRFRDLVTDFIPTVFGVKRFTPYTVGVVTDVQVGVPQAAPLALVLAASVLVLLLFRARAIVSRDQGRLFPVYLAGIGVIAAVVYPLARPLNIHTIRYGLLVLLVPIGVAALALRPGNRPVLRGTALAGLALIVICSTFDHVRIVAHAIRNPPPAPMREVIDRLLARRVHVAFSDYWRAYLITFLSGERIKVAATNFERILEYQAIAGRPVDDISPGGVVTIQKEPCDRGGETVAGWYLCDWR